MADQNLANDRGRVPIIKSIVKPINNYIVIHQTLLNSNVGERRDITIKNYSIQTTAISLVVMLMQFRLFYPLNFFRYLSYSLIFEEFRMEAFITRLLMEIYFNSVDYAACLWSLSIKTI